MNSKKLITNQIVDEYELPVSVSKEKDGFLALCPAWKDCYAQGDSFEEVLSEINLVALSLIEVFKEEHLPIPLKRRISAEKIGPDVSFTFPVYVSR
ncbi:MAG: type II toxin-antitoxin system HicB family antitoxin [Patescibacteria group bacterium]